ncbi:MAG: response regulator transcription factor [Ferruginibacter sp.]|nr:response regulator transcription factor [Ferruginibacter sp.]
MKTIPHKIILADDHILLRDALAGLVNSFKEFIVIATAADGNEVITSIKEIGQPDILLMDLNMPGMNGYDAATLIAQLYPRVKTVILSIQDSEIAILRLLQIGVAGFLKKDIHPDELKKALLVVASGKNYYSHEAAIKIIDLLRKKAESNLSLEELLLNEQELEFLKLVSTDMTYLEIARAMRLSLRHIERYRQALFVKLQVDSRVGLAIYAFRNGILDYK